MPRYLITVDEVQTCYYSVEADSPEDALEKVRHGDDDVFLEEMEGQGPLDGAEWWVIEEDENGQTVREYKAESEYGDITYRKENGNWISL